MHPSGADLAYLASLIDAGKLQVVIDRVFPFTATKEAMAYLVTGRAKGPTPFMAQVRSPSGHRSAVVRFQTLGNWGSRF